MIRYYVPAPSGKKVECARISIHVAFDKYTYRLAVMLHAWHSASHATMGIFAAVSLGTWSRRQLAKHILGAPLYTVERGAQVFLVYTGDPTDERLAAEVARQQAARVTIPLPAIAGTVPSTVEVSASIGKQAIS